MKIHIRRGMKADSVVSTQMVCSGVMPYHINGKFINNLLREVATHFSESVGMFEIILYDNYILRDDETDKSFGEYKQICTIIRDELLKASVHPEAIEIGFMEWTFPKSRKHKDEKVKMAIHIKIYNHKVMRIGVVDKMLIGDNGKSVREKYPDVLSMVKDLNSKAQELFVASTLCESSMLNKNFTDDEFKIVQAMALIDHANELIGGLKYESKPEVVEEVIK